MTAGDRHLLPGGPEIVLRVSRRARRYSLRVPATGGPPVLTMPAAASREEALRFALSRRGWLLRLLSAQPARIPVRPGAVLPVLGHALEVRSGSGRRTEARDGLLLVPGPPHRIGPRAADWVKARARDALTERAQHHAARLRRAFTRLDLRDTRGRWGSCSSAGRLMFSWRLALAPREVLDYVAAHEVAHLAQMNHGPRFWAEVARLCPGYEAPRTWLKENGATLHRYDFTPAEAEGTGDTCATGASPARH